MIIKYNNNLRYTYHILINKKRKCFDNVLKTDLKK